MAKFSKYGFVKISDGREFRWFALPPFVRGYLSARLDFRIFKHFESIPPAIVNEAVLTAERFAGDRLAILQNEAAGRAFWRKRQRGLYEPDFPRLTPG